MQLMLAPGNEFYAQYTNHQGHTRQRRLRVISAGYGVSEYHPDAQWLLRAVDLDLGQERTFALKHLEPVVVELPDHLAFTPRGLFRTGTTDYPRGGPFRLRGHTVASADAMSLTVRYGDAAVHIYPSTRTAFLIHPDQNGPSEELPLASRADVDALFARLDDLKIATERTA